MHGRAFDALVIVPCLIPLYVWPGRLVFTFVVALGYCVCGIFVEIAFVVVGFTVGILVDFDFVDVGFTAVTLEEAALVDVARLVLRVYVATGGPA